MGDDWKTWAFRQKVIQQLEDLIRQTPPTNNRNAHDMENQVYHRSTKREEYMQFIAKIIMHLRELAQNSNQNSNNPHLAAVLSGGSGPGNQMTGPGNQMGGQMGSGPSGGPMSGPGQIVSTSGSVVSGPNSSILSGQQPMQGNPRMGQPMPPSLPTQPGEMPTWGNNRRMPDMSMAGNKKPGNMAMGGINFQQNKMNNIQMGIPGQPGGPGSQLGQVPPQMMQNMGRGGTGPMQPRVPSPGFPNAVTGVPRQGTPASATIVSTAPMSVASSQQSPAFISPSPSGSMVPSPSGGMVRAGSHMSIPSPGGPINTPGQPQQPSPANNNDEIAYREKVRQLSKYIEPLRRVIERMGNEDEKSKKMKQLYDMLKNPTRRMPMDTLLKCELVLLKLDFKEEGPSAPPTMENRISMLNDAVANALKYPCAAHTLHRTFSPALSVLLGPTYPVNPTKRFKRDNPLQPPPETPNISDIVQGEVARLNSRFRVNLDCQQPPGSDDLTLLCQLDDPNLPCVPPITLTIPSAYPQKTPICDLLPVDYETTEFLKNIRASMLVRLRSMPPHCSITMILHSWEMSVRQACAPKQTSSATLSSIINNASIAA